MKKITSLILAALSLFSIVALTSCASTDKGTTSKAATISTVSGDTLTSGVITIGVDDSYPPMEYKDDSGNTVGFDIDMTNEIGKRLGKKVEYISTAWDGIFQALKTDKFDAIISSASMTTEKIAAYEFTKPYIANAQMLVVKPGDDSIKTAEDLAGKKVGCQVNTTANESATYLLETKKLKFTLNTYDTVIEPFQDMKAGRLDAIIVDEVVGEYYIGTDSKNFKASAVKLTNEPMGACFKKGNTVLRDEVQAAMDSMYADGTMKEISVKWFGKDLTSNIDSKPRDISE